VLVDYEGLAILSLLKIQSAPFGNIGESSGDEMNMHMPQNVLAETELRHLAAIPYQIVSPSSNAPIIGIYQDSLLGSYRFTRPGIRFSPRDAMNLLMMFPNVDVEALKGKKELTSFDVISQILPPMTMSYKIDKLFEEGEDYGTSNNVLDQLDSAFDKIFKEGCKKFAPTQKTTLY
jgi:DNA-directed RNA polymerase beta' subunit